MNLLRDEEIELARVRNAQLTKLEAKILNESLPTEKSTEHLFSSFERPTGEARTSLCSRSDAHDAVSYGSCRDLADLMITK